MGNENVFLFVSILLLLISVYMTAKLLFILFRLNKYIKTEGKIKKLDSKSLSVGVGASGMGAGGEDLKQILVEYSYSLDKTLFTGKDVNVWDKLKIFNTLLIKNYDKDLYAKLVDAFSNNNKITVWVDVDKMETLLTKKIYFGRVIFVFLCLLMSIFFIYIILN